MSTRTSTSSVVFTHPFTLPGLGRFYPAGSYRLDADEEQLDVSFEAWHRIATTIFLAEGPSRMAWLVTPADLAAALDADTGKVN